MKAQDTDEERRLAFDRAIAAYIRSRKEKVPAFVARYFSFKGALQLNKKAFGADLCKVPLNVAWSVPYLGMKVSAALEKNLVEYAKSRTAAADLAGNIITLSTGVAAFGQVTPGALTAGNTLAAVIANQIAVSNFLLGPTLGGFYYTVFPAAASTTLIAASTGALVMALAVLTSFSGIVTDPVQSRLGIHKRRLLRLIDSLDGQLRGDDESRLKIRAQYYARVFDLLDLLRRASRTLI